LNNRKTEADGRDAAIAGWSQNGGDRRGVDSQPSSPRPETSGDESPPALQRRPSISIRRQLSLGFLLWFLLTLTLAIVSIEMISRIIAKLAFLEAATNYTFEIQQARRFEKNYFLYRTNLSDALEHVHSARGILEEEGRNIVSVIGRPAFDTMTGHLQQYEELISRLPQTEQNQDLLLPAAPLAKIEAKLREHGADMVAVAEDLVLKERKSVNSMLGTSQRVPLAFLGILILLMIYLVGFLSRRVLSPLNRMMRATQRIAQGDFTPMLWRRKYHDEFSELTLAMNHMMHQLTYRQELLVRAHKLKAVGTLTAGVAHELNNPINNIILTASVLQEDFRELSDEKCLALVNDLVGESERAQKIVRNLLEFARESEVELESHKVQDIVEATLRLASNQIKLARVKVEGEVEEHLPAVYGDRQQLEQVFLNLVLNALDAMPDGGVLRIELSQTEDREFVTIKFADTGVGIAKQHLREIFDPFFTSKKAAKGTGLGLSVSLGIVQRHGGDIRVESEVGKGAVFTVLLPVTKVPANIGNPLGSPDQ
jgi:two-component system NtrC family sensor kinase